MNPAQINDALTSLTDDQIGDLAERLHLLAGYSRDDLAWLAQKLIERGQTYQTEVMDAFTRGRFVRDLVEKELSGLGDISMPPNHDREFVEEIDRELNNMTSQPFEIDAAQIMELAALVSSHREWDSQSALESILSAGYEGQAIGRSFFESASEFAEHTYHASKSLHKEAQIAFAAEVVRIIS